MTAKTTRERVREMTEQGHSPRDIALVLRVSTQAVYKHLAALRDGHGGKEKVS